ncbi:MAG: hypothetical protein AAGC56_06705 [Pseudomonadota bacterium]
MPKTAKEGAGIAERYASSEEAAPRAIAGWLQRLSAEPLLPEAGAGGAPLTAVIAVISFLAALALAAFMVITAASGTWTDALNATLTIQVKGDAPESVAANLAATRAVLDETPGVSGYDVTEPEDAAALLEPWLGKGNVGAYLNVPALIEVRADARVRDELDQLQARLDAAAPGVVVDDHGEWRAQLAAAARSGQFLSFGVFAVVMAAACAIAVFAARAGLAANENVVSLLHLVGATDRFAADEVQRRFVILALRGAFAGVAAALLALSLAGLAAQTAGGDRFFVPGFAMSGWLLASLFVVPLGVALVTAVSARLTVLQTLRTAY